MAKKMKVCSFCGKTEDKVLMMIQGNNGVCACSECITGIYDTLYIETETYPLPLSLIYAAAYSYPVINGISLITG